MKKYFVQIRHDDGDITLTVKSSEEIIKMIGMSDCSGDEIEVYEGSNFGDLIKLQYAPAISAPFNFHVFINPNTHEIEFEGYSPEH